MNVAGISVLLKKRRRACAEEAEIVRAGVHRWKFVDGAATEKAAASRRTAKLF